MVRKNDCFLIVLYLAVCAVILLRIYIESTHYCSNDSPTYLEVAQNLSNKKGYVHTITAPDNIGNNQVIPLTTWPVGYPTLIYLTHQVLPFNMLWVSKAVNLLCLGILFLLTRMIYREKALFFALTFCSFTFLEIFSYTWSEAPFLVALLWFCYLLHHYLKTEQIKYLFLLFIAGFLMFLFRYIGVFVCGYLTFITLYFFLIYKRKYWGLIAVTMLLIIFISGYFLHNYLVSGDFDGADRLHPGVISNSSYFKALLIGFFNEFFIIRNYYFKNDRYVWLFFLMAGVQIGVITLFYKKEIQKINFAKRRIDTFSKLYFSMGGIYLFVIGILIRLGTCNLFDYRIMAPFTMLLVFGILHEVSRHEKLYRQLKYYWVVLFLFSLIMNLPKLYILGLFFKINE